MKEIKDDIKQMERYSMFLGGKNKYCGNDYRWQPTRLPRPWDSPGKNTGVGCHFLLQCRKVKSGSEVAQSCPTRSNPMDCSPPGSSVHGIFQARVLEWVAIAFSNDYTTKHNLQNQCNPYQIINGIFHRTRTKNFTVHVETQKTPNCQSSLEKE